MAFKYSIVCDTLKWIGYDLLDDPRSVLGKIKAAGYDGADLPGDLKRTDPSALKPIADDLGLRIPEVLGAWAYFHAGENRDLAGLDESARQAGVAYARQAIDLAAALGAEFFQICAAQPPIPQIPFPEAPIPVLRKNFSAACREICAHAAERGVAVLFEPLNQYEAYPGVMTSVYDAIRVIDELGYDNLGVQPDVFHMNISEASIPDALRAAGKRIRVVHMNETNHYRLGAGHADYAAIMRTLKDLSFEGWISIYMPFSSQEVMQMTGAGYGRAGGSSAPAGAARPDLETVLREQLHFLKEIEAAVDAQRAIYAAGGV